jgi:hypothetical protein
VGGLVSFELPAEWVLRAWPPDEVQYATAYEDGYAHRTSFPMGAMPGMVHVARRPAEGKSAAAVLQELLAQRRAQVLPAGDPVVTAVQGSDGPELPALPGTDSASAVSAGGMGPHLDCVWVRGEDCYVLSCEGPRARFGELGPIFARVARSFWFAQDGEPPA